MASNPYVNKVVFGSSTLIDLTSDTVVAGKLARGYTAHDASGAAITGTYDEPTAATSSEITAAVSAGWNGTS